MENYLKLTEIWTTLEEGFWAKQTQSYLLLEWDQEENEELGFQGF